MPLKNFRIDIPRLGCYHVLMVKVIIFSLIAGVGGLWIATKFVPGVTFAGSWQTLLILGVILGAVIAVMRPLLDLVSLILRIVLLGISSVAILWILKLIFPALVIAGFVPLLIAAGVIAGITIILSIFK